MVEPTNSILVMKNLYFSHYEFMREADIESYETKNIKLGLGKKTEFENNLLTVHIMFQAILDGAFDLKLTTVGVFECNSETTLADSFEKNAISIMFPYIRSEITLLTSQPNFKPIIIPPVNIQAIFEKLEKDEKQEL